MLGVVLDAVGRELEKNGVSEAKGVPAGGELKTYPLGVRVWRREGKGIDHYTFLFSKCLLQARHLLQTLFLTVLLRAFPPPNELCYLGLFRVGRVLAAARGICNFSCGP